MNFRQKVYKIVKQIPKGQVTTYGAIALMLDNVRLSRQVGYALRAIGKENQDMPWWRVVNKKGYISINHGEGGVEKEIQKTLLEDEGVEVNGLTVNLDKHLWNN